MSRSAPIPPHPAKRVSAVDVCEARLRDAILSGALAPGDRLPPERELAEREGVNRATVRSALTRLAEAGLVASRQGDGCVVRDYRESAGLELVSALLERARGRDERAAIAADLLAIRRAVAGVVLERLAASPPKPRVVERARKAARAFAEAVAGGASSAELARRDREVLAAFVEASGSPVIGLLLNPVAATLADFADLTAALYLDPEAHVRVHEAVVAWAEAPERALVAPMLDAMAAHDAAVVARVAKPRPAPRAKPRSAARA
jgi:DNA-binding FadR family transcriptional regulator